jgi:hypothetical protein
MLCEGSGHGKVWGDEGKAARRGGAGGFAVSGQLGNLGAKKNIYGGGTTLRHCRCRSRAG